MPELPEVQTVVDTLRPSVTGRKLLRVELRRPDIVRPCGFDLVTTLEGRVVASIARRGKRIVFTLRGGDQFYIHLGMTGRLTVEANAAPVEKHTHFVATLVPGGRQ